MKLKLAEQPEQCELVELLDSEVNLEEKCADVGPTYFNNEASLRR